METDEKLRIFLDKAVKNFPEYDFSLVKEYKNNITKVPIICHKKDYAGREHGIFMISPNNLLNGRGCPKCSGKCISNEDRKLFCSILHDYKYDYSNSDFSESKKITSVICPEHGEFKINYDRHFNRKIGCKFCSCHVRDLESFKKEASKKHKYFYSYDKSVYKNSHTKLIITCPIHGDFMQTPNAHLRGEGCPECIKTSILEEKIDKVLENNALQFVKNKRTNWLKTENNGQSHLDFYLPEINLAIECQGKQHFGYGGWSNEYNKEKRFKIDKWKKEQCDKHNIELIYFANKYEAPDEYIGKIFTNEKELLDYVKYLFINKK